MLYCITRDGVQVDAKQTGVMMCGRAFAFNGAQPLLANTVSFADTDCARLKAKALAHITTPVRFAPTCSLSLVTVVSER